VVNITVDAIRWVRVGEPVTNSANELTELYGGGGTPGYFGEPRFEGKYVIYYVNETSIAMDDRDVDHGFEYYNVHISSSFDAPPAVLIPGESYELTVTFTHSGTVVEGNPGARFEYRSDKNHSSVIQPYASFLYNPYYPGFSGQDSATWTLNVPDATAGDTLEIYAFWWNSPPCNVTWFYQAE